MSDLCRARIGKNAGNIRGGELCGRKATREGRWCGYHDPASRARMRRHTAGRMRRTRAARARVYVTQSRLLSELAKAPLSEFITPDLRRAVEEYREALGLTVTD